MDDVIRDHSAKSFVETSDKGFLHQVDFSLENYIRPSNPFYFQRSSKRT